MYVKIQFIMAMIIFGSMGLFVRAVSLPPSIVVLGRGMIGAAFLTAVLFLGRKRFTLSAVKKNILILIPCGIFLGLDWIFLFEAYKRTTISISTVIYYFAPIILVLVSALVWKEKISRKKAVCIITSFIGMFLVIGITPVSLSDRDFGGMMFALGAAAAYACLTLFNRQLKEIPVLESTIIQMLTAVMTVLPYAVLSGDIFSIKWSGAEISIVAILGIVHTGIAFWFYFLAVKKMKIQSIAVLSYLDPMTALIISTLFLNETMNAVQAAGAVLIFGAAFFSEWIERNQK